MAYSTIKRKLCKCGCGKLPTLSFNGWNYSCAPDKIKEKVKSQKKETAKRRNQRIVSKLKALPANIEMVNHKKELDEWFAARALEMTGICANCGGRTTKGDPKYWKFSIAHILPKNKIKSLATHPLNFIELCHFGKSCHKNMDDKILNLQDMKCWNDIQSRFAIMYPYIPKEEYQFIPDTLLNSLP